MESDFGTIITKVLLAVVGVAILALILSPNSQTSNVLKSAADGFSKILNAATSPVTGGSSGSVGLGLNSLLGGLGALNSGTGFFGG